MEKTAVKLLNRIGTSREVAVPEGEIVEKAG
jgi:hypothetical protein